MVAVVVAVLMVVVVVDAMVVSSFLHPCPTILAVVAALCELPKKVHTGYERDDDQLRCVTGEIHVLTVVIYLSNQG